MGRDMKTTTFLILLAGCLLLSGIASADSKTMHAASCVPDDEKTRITLVNKCSIANRIQSVDLRAYQLIQSLQSLQSRA